MSARLDHLPARANDRVHVVVECPRGSSVKVTYAPELGAMRLGRMLPAGVVFPHDFGFVPSTLAEDGDPLDGMVLGDVPSHPGVVAACRPVAVLEATQKESTGERVRNDRVLFVADGDFRREDVTDVRELPARLLEEIAAFFVAAVALEGKELQLLGWKGREVAEAAITRAEETFRRRH